MPIKMIGKKQGIGMIIQWNEFSAKNNMMMYFNFVAIELEMCCVVEYRFKWEPNQFINFLALKCNSLSVTHTKGRTEIWLNLKMSVLCVCDKWKKIWK